MSAAFDHLLQIMTALRSEKGCPWDKQQTLQSLKPYVLEECYELLEAIDNGDPKHLQEELGDMFFELVFCAQILKEQSHTSCEDILKAVCEKLIQRHPHVFAEDKVSSAEEVAKKWEERKAKEKASRSSRLEGVPKSLPALLRSEKLQNRAAQVGFDWKDYRGSLLKIKEELAEVEHEIEKQDQRALEEELGDLLFATTRLCSKFNISAESAMQQANEKFIRRFQAMEKNSPRPLSELNIDEQMALWNAQKQS